MRWGGQRRLVSLLICEESKCRGIGGGCVYLNRVGEIAKLVCQREFDLRGRGRGTCESSGSVRL